MTVFNELQHHRATSAADQAGIPARASAQFPSPWLDPASAELPTNIEDVFKFCELLWYANGTYQQALNRIAAYFVTKIKVEDVEREEQERWEDYLHNQLHINKLMVEFGRNYLAYGNTFISPRVSVNRRSD